ncbi:hypothetical protein SVIO_086080 [Streptomyces violaceusniger]|uniref:Uncharacterized protein n=1 Tax=Streptomyces violaceusniger TaxID=68280 RepID=A0A4D4LA41_STRVO|nr:hypothetical protein SVIO_086080 [Streptomyces violaceusniger]
MLRKAPPEAFHHAVRSESKSSAANSSTTAAGQAPSPSPEPAATDRAARRAVTVFPLLVLAAGAAGLATPGTFSGWAPNVPYLLGVVMFCMGLTMTPGTSPVWPSGPGRWRSGWSRTM